MRLREVGDVGIGPLIFKRLYRRKGEYNIANGSKPDNQYSLGGLSAHLPVILALSRVPSHASSGFVGEDMHLTRTFLLSRGLGGG